MSHQETPTEPGWYDHPSGERNMQRYWNGDEWSGAPRRRPPQLEWSGIVLIVVGVIVVSALSYWFWFS
ncbi:MAG: DUF2510 domain-containing protein [Acidimicrobiia bacterium]